MGAFTHLPHLVRFNRTKWGRCVKAPIVYFCWQSHLWSVKSVLRHQKQSSYNYCTPH